jgi:hypothetical protein
MVNISVMHIEKALLSIKEIDANITYFGMSPEQMMEVKDSMKDKYFEKFIYRKAKALSMNPESLEEGSECLKEMVESKDKNIQELRQ